MDNLRRISMQPYCGCCIWYYYRGIKSRLVVRNYVECRNHGQSHESCTGKNDVRWNDSYLQY